MASARFPAASVVVILSTRRPLGKERTHAAKWFQEVSLGKVCDWLLTVALSKVHLAAQRFLKSFAVHLRVGKR